MRHVRAFRAALGLPLLLAFALPADDVSFHPKDGSVLEKKLEVELEFKPEEIEVALNGEEMPDESFGGLDESLVVKLAVGVTEKFVASKDGRPTDLLRTFDELALSMKAGSESEEAPDFDRLEGKTVRFHWKEEGETYERSFHESEGDDVLLLNLFDDMDLRALLPAKNVAEGDTWDVPGSKLLPLFLPGGLPGEVGNDADTAPLRAALEEIQDEFGKLVEDGKLACKYAGSRDESGVRVAEIRFTLTSKGEVDFSKALEILVQEEEVAPTMDATATIDLGGEGKVLWDLAAGRVHAFEMKLDTKIDLDVKAQADVEGESFEFTVTGRIAGTGNWNLATSAP
jgi:hypothetical protein